MDKTSLNSNAGNSIAEFRKFRNVTQDKLAEMIGSNRVVIARIESGKIVPSLDFVNKVARALDAELDISFSPISNQDDYLIKNVVSLKDYICVNCQNRWQSKNNKPVIQCPACHNRQGVSYADYQNAYEAIQKIVTDVKNSPPGKKAPPVRTIRDNTPAMFKLIRETVASTFPSPKLPFSVLFKIYARIKEGDGEGGDVGKE